MLSESIGEAFPAEVTAQWGGSQIGGKEGVKDMVGRRERGRPFSEVEIPYAVAGRQDALREPNEIQNGWR